MDVAIEVGNQHQLVFLRQTGNDGACLFEDIEYIGIAIVSHLPGIVLQAFLVERQMAFLRQILHLELGLHGKDIVEVVVRTDERKLRQGAFTKHIGFAEGFLRNRNLMGNILFPQHFCPMATVGVNRTAIVEDDTFNIFQCFHCLSLLGVPVPTFMSMTPMIIQTNSRTRVMRLV